MNNPTRALPRQTVSYRTKPHSDPALTAISCSFPLKMKPRMMIPIRTGTLVFSESTIATYTTANLPNLNGWNSYLSGGLDVTRSQCQGGRRSVCSGSDLFLGMMSRRSVSLIPPKFFAPFILFQHLPGVTSPNISLEAHPLLVVSRNQMTTGSFTT